MFGKDSTYSGRTELWDFMISEISNHPILGVGFQGYWIPSRLKYKEIYDIFNWLPIQAHNGYLDILNEIGFIGIFLLVAAISNYFFNLRRIQKPHTWSIFIILAVISNVSESSFLRVGEEVNFMFLFAYTYLFYSLLQERFDKSGIKTKNSIRKYKFS
jgi:O-antigen ligase